MEKEKKKIFWKILDTLKETETEGKPGPFFLEFPRTLFMQAVCIFRQNFPAVVLLYEDLLEEFLNYLDEKEIRIDYRVRRRLEEAVVSLRKAREKEEKKRMIREAIRREWRWRKMLGDDY